MSAVLEHSSGHARDAVRGWRRPALWTALAPLAAVLAVYHETFASMAAVWARSDTFMHGFPIAPVSCILIWTRRSTLAALRPQPCLPALLLLAAAGMVWLLATLSDVSVARQYAAVAMIPASLWAVLGTRMAGAMAFSLAFLLLAVPFGEAFIPALIDLTASLTVHALQLTGIPVYREGNAFTIPSGAWSVVEACSGLRYLIASLTLGSLYAHLSYRSWTRKAAFIALSAIVPIAANSVRAYLIVMLGHLAGTRAHGRCSRRPADSERGHPVRARCPLPGLALVRHGRRHERQSLRRQAAPGAGPAVRAADRRRIEAGFSIEAMTTAYMNVYDHLLSRTAH